MAIFDFNNRKRKIDCFNIRKYMCLISRVTGCNLISGEELQHLKIYNIMLLSIKTITTIIIIVLIIILILIINSDNI